MKFFTFFTDLHGVKGFAFVGLCVIGITITALALEYIAYGNKGSKPPDSEK